MKRREFLKVGTLATATAAFGEMADYSGATAQSDAFDSEQAPGTWSLSPDVLVSGTTTPLALHYVQGDTPLPPGTYHRVVFEPLSVKRLLFAPPSEDLKLSPLNGPLPKIDLQPSRVSGVGFREITLVFPDGLDAGASFALEVGNRNADGEIIALVNPVPVQNLTFETYSGYVGGKAYSWLTQGWTDHLPRVEIKANKPAALRLFGPSLIETGKPFDLRFSVVDRFDGRAWPFYRGEVHFTAPAKLEGLPKSVRLKKKDECVATLSGLSFSEPGIYRISARLGRGNNVFESNPIVVRNSVTAPIYWGSMHNHTHYSECWGDSLDTTYRFARDVSGYDFAAISDHRGAVPQEGWGQGRLLAWRLGHRIDSVESWNENIEKANEYNVPHEFVTLIGYEYSCQDIGHHNIYVTEVKDNNDIFPKVFRNGAFELCEKMVTADALFIPHAHADIMPFTRLDLRDNTAGEPITPVYEVYSDWGDACEPYGNWPPNSLFGGLRRSEAHSYLWAIENGYKLGVIGDTDGHTGLPGRRATAGIAPAHCHPHGITAAIMEDFTRDGLMNAYRRRHTYGTTGERIFLDVQAGDVGMGSTLRTDEPFSIRVVTAGTAPITAVRLYQGLTLVEEKSLDGAREGEVKFTGLVPQDVEKGYVVTVIQEDENRAWASPIWVRRASVPELVWSRDSEGRPVLTNQGGGEARDVVIVHSEDESPFTVDRIAGYDPGENEIAGMLWTVPKDNNTVAVYYRWRGEARGGNIRLDGFRDYSVDFCREWFITNTEFSDDGQGHCRFYTGKPIRLRHSLGMDFLVTIDPKKPATFTIEFDQSQATYVGDRKQHDQQITLVLNGRTSTGPLPKQAVVSLAPGEKWTGLAQRGYWAADPYNAILETVESNNLLRL